MRGIFATLVVGFAVLVAVPAAAVADNGKAGTTMSFFSGGGGAHADWLATDDQPSGDTDHQAVRLVTTDQGYAGILFHHVTGIPAADFPDSEFWNKAPAGPTLGSPRLVVAFQNPLGQFDGYGDLRENARLTSDWEQVSDIDTFPNSAWDVMGGPCGFRYNVHWTDVQACFPGDTVLSVYLTTDPYGISHLIDDLQVNGKTFSSASDNSNGNNDPAGPDATTDPSLLPPLMLPSTLPH